MMKCENCGHEMPNPVRLAGWKGKDAMEIFKDDKTWHVVTHQKDKDTGKITETDHLIPFKNVKVLWAAIKKLCKRTGDKTRFRDLAAILIKYYGWYDIDNYKTLLGSRKTYFTYFYYCAKILEFHEYIHYGGSGVITRLVYETTEE